MSVTWRKVWRDLTLQGNRLRTVLAVLSIAAGVFALGLAFGAHGVMRTYIEADKQVTRPAHFTFRGGISGQETFSQDLVDELLRKPGVADAESETHVPFRWKLEGETDWQKGMLIARADYAAQRVGLIELLAGRWPARHTLAVERKSSQYFGVPLGATILAESGQDERRLPVEGMVRKPYVLQPQFGGEATFYATPETVAWLTGVEGANQLRIRLEGFGSKEAGQAGEQIRGWLERLGLSASGVGATGYIDEIDVQGMQDSIDAVFLILIVMGALSLGASAFLITNTMNAIIVQQTWQIGVMKAVGATFARIVRIYLATALAYGGLALLLAVPSAAICAHWLAGWLLDTASNIAPASTLHVSLAAIAAQIATGALVPLLAALPLVIAGARINSRQAISSRGLGSGFGEGPLDRLIGRVRGLPRPVALCLRNTFRRKGRIALTLATLTFAGALFIMAMSVQASFDNTIEALLNSFRYDVMVVFPHPRRAEHLIGASASVPGVTAVEVWDRRDAELVLASTSSTRLGVGVYGVPPHSQVFNPHIASGRSLLPDDGRAILLNKNIAADHGIQVGDEVTLKMAGKETTWTVVGLILNATVGQSDNFVPFDTLTQAAGSPSQGSIVMLASEGHDAQAQARLIGALSNVYAERGIETTTFQSASQAQEKGRTFFGAILYLLLTMVIVAAIVGSLGLTGTLSINVVERRREIGVMRALGAKPSAIATIFVTEGMLVGALSWLFAVPLSYPGARAFSDAVGNAALGTRLDFSYSFGGIILWLVVVLVLSALASLWPAVEASRVSVREALAYE